MRIKRRKGQNQAQSYRSDLYWIAKEKTGRALYGLRVTHKDIIWPKSHILN